MKVLILFSFFISVIAFGKTELNCTAKSSVSLHDDTAKLNSLAAHKALAKAKKEKHQK